MYDKREIIEGCLMGCAVGDSVCLPYEGISPRRLVKWVRFPLRHRFILGRGMVSDDTDHSLFVAQSLARSPNDPERFAHLLAWRFRLWLLCIPAGIGLATLKSILRLWFGKSPFGSGVFSAGNGAAMRSAIIGVIHCNDDYLRREISKASSAITHSDPKAQFGAQSVADLAALLTRTFSRPTVPELEKLLLETGEGEGWREAVSLTINACKSGVIEKAVTLEGLKHGVSGYILHTLPVAVAAWYINFGDFRKTIETVVKLGGDTDTVAAIAGSLAGVTCGRKGIPEEWIARIIDRPHSVEYIEKLAATLSEGRQCNTGFSWWLLPRGILFTAIVLVHGLRRLLPPY